MEKVIHDKEAIFTGKRRPTLTRICACGCGETFTTTHPKQKYLNDAHRKRHDRKMSAHVRGQTDKKP